MGSSGEKRSRKRHKKPEHLPKVGTATENRIEQRGEREAVLANMGLGRNVSPAVRWIVGIVVIVAIVVAIVALVGLD